VTTIDHYLRQLENELRLRGIRNARILAEAREHLLDCCDDAEARGLTREAAERDATRRFGVPEIVAAGFVGRSYSMLNRLIVATCASTMLAVAALTVSVTVLRPPHLNYTASGVLGLMVVAQSAVTVFAVLTARSTARSWLRLALSIGGGLLVAAGMLGLREVMFGAHFEGYALIVGLLLVFQGALTMVRGIRDGGRGALMRRV
jgi:hypothetical protein